MRDRNPRQIHPLERTSIPYRHITFDTEAHVTERAGGHVQRWAVGAASYDNLDPRRRNPLTERATFTAPERLWAWVLERCSPRQRTVLWAFNLAYDLRIAGALVHLPRAGFTLDGISLEGTAAWAIFRNGPVTLLCCDLRSWLPATLADVGRDLGLGKTEDWRPGLTRDQLRQHVERDVEITRAAALTVLQFVRDEDLGPFRPTGAGQSNAAWRRRFLTHPPHVHADPDLLALERTAMWTGRCEAWQHGKLSTGPYVEYDLERCYANIAHHHLLPARLHARWASPSVRRYERLRCEWKILARVRVTTSEPVAPAAHQGRMIWPVGTFDTVLWDPEIDLALQHGADLELLEAWLYEPAPVLRDVTGWILDGLEDPDAVTPPLVRRMLKHWSRAVVGRVAMRYREWEEWARTEEHGLELGVHLDRRTGHRTDYLHVGRSWRVLSALRESDGSLPMVTGYVMSEARRRLYELSEDAGPMGVVYMDTDSLIASPPGALLLEERIARDGAYGLRAKDTWRRLEIRGPRNLALDTTPRIAGVPLRHRRVAPLEFETEHWSTLKASMLTGELDHVSVHQRRIQVLGRDPRREHLPYTLTRPIRLGGEPDASPDRS